MNSKDVSNITLSHNPTQPWTKPTKKLFLIYTSVPFVLLPCSFIRIARIFRELFQFLEQKFFCSSFSQRTPIAKPLPSANRDKRNYSNKFRQLKNNKGRNKRLEKRKRYTENFQVPIYWAIVCQSELFTLFSV